MRPHDRAEELLQRSGILAIRQGKLCAGSLEQTRALHSFVAGASTLRSDAPLELVLRGSDLKTLIVRTAPLSPPQRGRTPRARVILFLHDPTVVPPVPEELLAEMWRLSPAEARLASALAKGFTLEEHAERSQITRHTARAHLKRIFAKTSARKQADLVRLLSGRFARAVRPAR